jgi:hypothetical protein
VGTNGTGKSRFLKEKLNLYPKGKRILIIDFDGLEPTWENITEIDILNDVKTLKTYTGVRKIILSRYENAKDVFKILYNNFRNGVIVFDDAAAYIEAKITAEQRILMIRRKQMNVDYFAVFHGVTEIPPKLFIYGKYLTIFQTMDSLEQNNSKFKNVMEQIQAIKNYVDTRAQLNQHYNITIDLKKL